MAGCPRHPFPSTLGCPGQMWWPGSGKRLLKPSAGHGCAPSGCAGAVVPGKNQALCNMVFQLSVAREGVRMWGKAKDFPFRLQSLPSPLQNPAARNPTTPRVSLVPFMSQSPCSPFSNIISYSPCPLQLPQALRDQGLPSIPPGALQGLLIHLSSPFAIYTVEKAGPGKQWQQNTSWATSPKCLGVATRCR